jgi:hypothetical protein
MKHSRTLLLATAIALSTATSPSAQSEDRIYSYLYPTTTAAKGEWECEHWFTYSAFNSMGRFDFRHEIEYGVTDRFQLGLSLANWRYEHPHAGKSGADFRSTSLEAIYNLTDPEHSPFGSALYGEISLGDQEFELEAKLLLEKNFGPLNIAYNFKFESEWEGTNLGELDESNALFGNYLGASYPLLPGCRAGFELVHEWESENWKSRSDDDLYLGPSLSWSKGEFYLTATALWSLLEAEGSPRNQVRLIAGFEF